MSARKVAPALRQRYARSRWVEDENGKRMPCAFNDRKAEVMALLACARTLKTISDRLHAPGAVLMEWMRQDSKRALDRLRGASARKAGAR